MSKIRMGREILYSPYHNVLSDEIVIGEIPLQWQCITSKVRDPEEWAGMPHYCRWRIAIEKGLYNMKNGDNLLYFYVNRGGKNLNLLVQKYERNYSDTAYQIVVQPIALRKFIGPNFNTSTKRGLKKVAKRMAVLFQK